MNLFIHCQQAYANLKAAKLRSFLAALGILVGSGSVVALINCGQLATEKALAQFKTLGTNLVAITVFATKLENGSKVEDEMTLQQWRELGSHVANISQIAPYATAYQTISIRGKTIRGVIIGADESLAKVLNIKMVGKSNFLSFVQTFEQYCVIGAKVAEEMRQAGVMDPVNQQLRMGNTLYTVVGVIKKWPENSFFNADLNQAVMIPIAGMSLISKNSKINSAVIRLKSVELVEQTITRIKEFILQNHKNLNIFIRSAQQIINSMENQGLIFTWLLGIIASISLLVGGIGIMNIMLVAVTERKKEIGIRKAVGARNKDIQILFLTESIILSLFGGILGVVLGLIATRIIAYFTAWPFTVFILPIIIGFLVAVLTGIFFGFYPARRASLLEPIVSLRSE